MDHAQIQEDDKNIAAALTIENESLRGKLSLLMERMERLEQREAQRSSGFHSHTTRTDSLTSICLDNTHLEEAAGGAMPSQILVSRKTNPSKLDGLEKMMVEIQIAKDDALRHGESSRDQLQRDITYLHNLLKKSKVEQVSSCECGRAPLLLISNSPSPNRLRIVKKISI